MFRKLVFLSLTFVLILVGITARTTVPEQMIVDWGDNGRWIEMLEKQGLSVRLESNPATGYSWEILILDEDVLSPIGQVSVESGPTVDPVLIGSGNIEVFRFEAQKRGSTTLKMIYIRPWEDAEPLQTFTLRIFVD